MGKQTSTTVNKSRKVENMIGKGKVTPVQIAFIVDRYLSDNNYTQTRSNFRSEASNLISKSSVLEAPKSLLSLGAMLDEYICLKEEKVRLEQERCRMEQEKLRVHNLLHGMQDAMNGFNAAATTHEFTPPPPPPPLPPPPPISKSGFRTPNVEQLPIGSPPGGYYSSAYKSTAVISTSKPSKTREDTTNISTEIRDHPLLKRKGSKVVSDASITIKRSCRSSTSKQLLPRDTKAHPQPTMENNYRVVSRKHPVAKSQAEGCNVVQSSHVVKCLFNQPAQSPPTNSSGPKTPPLESFSQAEKSASPLEKFLTGTSSKDVTPQQVNCTIISSETIQISPAKQISYYSIARNQHISTSSPAKANLKKLNKRDHVKGRLDFDTPDKHTPSEKPTSTEIPTSECVKEVDILDLELEALENINLSELLVDFDLLDERTSYSTEPAVDSSPDSISWSPQKLPKVDIGANQVFTQLSSTVTEILAEKDVTISGPDSVTTVKSVTKTFKILSPAKGHRSCSDGANLLVENRLD
ncbi:hypothetical protein ACH5RR_004931 [Cinchona calisaya]|uniref:Uncharacterized protein n=1 Tax=Cinchona calisaya TaxID=153742 RepID=A0ABD3AYX5_9GENT